MLIGPGSNYRLRGRVLLFEYPAACLKHPLVALTSVFGNAVDVKHEVVIRRAFDKQHPAVVDEGGLPRTVLVPDLPPKLPGDLAWPEDLPYSFLFGREAAPPREQAFKHFGVLEVIKHAVASLMQLCYGLLYFLQRRELFGPGEKRLHVHVPMLAQPIVDLWVTHQRFRFLRGGPTRPRLLARGSYPAKGTGGRSSRSATATPRASAILRAVGGVTEEPVSIRATVTSPTPATAASSRCVSPCDSRHSFVRASFKPAPPQSKSVGQRHTE